MTEAKEETFNSQLGVPCPEHKAIEDCTKGLLDKLNIPAAHSKTGLDIVNSRQAHLADRVSIENDRFQRLKEEFNLEEAIQKTRFYHQKLHNLHREMLLLSDRSANLKVRAMKLLDAKQEEALKRVNRRQMELEREEQLVAKPATKKN